MIRRIADIVRHDRFAAAAAAGLGIYILCAITAPLLSPYDPYALGETPVAAPSLMHWFGTDQLARDIFSRVIHGARVSLMVAFGAVAMSLIAGSLIGVAAGYAGGLTDTLLSRTVEMLFALPAILLALVMMAIFGQGTGNVMLAIAIVYTPIFTRLARGQTLAIKRQPFIEAARATGVGHRRIVTQHILPNIAGPLVVQATLSLAFAMLAEAALSFLGLGAAPDTPTWGNMLRAGVNWMERAWWIAVFPGLAISGAVLSLNVLGDRLRDHLTQRGAGG